MSARILDGAAVALQIRGELSSRPPSIYPRAGRQPGLGIVLVGDKSDSQIYVNSKLKSAGDEGMRPRCRICRLRRRSMKSCRSSER